MRRGLVLFLLSYFIFQFGCASGSGFAAMKSAQVENLAEKEKVDPVDPVGIYEWDFGRIKQGVISKHDFILKNQSAKVLEITSIHTSCGCTATESGKKSLNPQESTAIKVSFNSAGYLGQVQQFVYVNTDNVDLGIIKLIINAEVIKEG